MDIIFGEELHCGLYHYKVTASLIITTIASPNEVLKQFASQVKEHNVDFIVIGDAKSPKDFSLDGCRFLNIEEQKSLPFELARQLPFNHYARKNIGYLLAKKSDIIFETDDDNFPLANFFDRKEKNQNVNLYSGTGWLNAYSFFTKKNIWPRGFSLDEINNGNKNFTGEHKVLNCSIQQGLCNGEADVDAIYRLTNADAITFEDGDAIALDKNVWCPFNSQNTVWFNTVFPLLYLPAFASFRMCDIWRSFIAQRILWTMDEHLLFSKASVFQKRNEHNLMNDFEDEVSGYLLNKKICNDLQSIDLKRGRENITENLSRCYRMMIEKKYLPNEELKLLDSWCNEF